MRVLIAGATGVIGRQAVPRLAAAGHDVIGLSRSPRARGMTGECAGTAGARCTVAPIAGGPADAKA